MASYLSETYQFAPYVETMPIEAMVKVGMAKQKMYDEGVQKVQGYFDQLTALPTIRESDAELIQRLTSTLGTDVTKMVGADWSNQQLVSAVGSVAAKISRDKNVVAAVQSAQNASGEMKLLDEDRTKGELLPENEDMFLEELANFRKTTDLGRTFTSKYIKGFDVEKYAKERFDATMKADGITYDQVFETDANGRALIDPATGKRIYSPTMARLEKEGVYGEKVRKTLEQIFSEPRVARQLEITGRYVYKPLEGDRLKEKVLSQRDEMLLDSQNTLTELYYQKSKAESNEAKRSYDILIEKIKSGMGTINGYYDSLLKSADENAPGVRANLYKNELKNQFTSSFSWEKTKYLQMDNPGAKYNIDLQKLAFDRDKFAKEYEFNVLKEKNLNRRHNATLANNLLIAQTRAAGKGGGGVSFVDTDGDGVPETPVYDEGPETEGTRLNMPSNVDGYAVAMGDLARYGENFENATNSLIWNGKLEKSPENVTLLNKYMNAGMTQPQAINKIIEEQAKRAGMDVPTYRAANTSQIVSDFNKMTPEQRKASGVLGDLVNTYTTAQRDFGSMSQIVNEIEGRAGYTKFSKEKVIQDLNIQPQKIELYGKTYDLSPEDVYNLGLYLRGKKSIIPGWEGSELKQETNRAAEALEKRGLRELMEAVISSETTGIGDYFANPVSTGLRWLKPNRLYDLGYSVLGSGTAGRNVDWGQVGKVAQHMEDETFLGTMSNRRKAAEAVYTVPPVVGESLFIGKPQYDNAIRDKVKRMNAEYGTGQKQNESETFTSFQTAINNDTKNKLGFGVASRVKPDGTPEYQVVAYNESKEVLGAMTVEEDELKNLNVDPSKIFESPSIRILRNVISSNKLKQTSAGNPEEYSTYQIGDSYYKKGDFVNLQNTDLNVQVNIKEVKGLYYPYVYISDGTKEKVIKFKGDDNLTRVYNALNLQLTPNFVQQQLSR